jgi:hypothetical protein
LWHTKIFLNQSLHNAFNGIIDELGIENLYAMKLFLISVILSFGIGVFASALRKVYLANPYSNEISLSYSNLILSIDNLSVYVINQAPDNIFDNRLIEIPMLSSKVLIALKRQMHDLDGENASSEWSNSIHRVVGNEIIMEQKDLILIYVDSAEWEESFRDLISPLTAIIPSSDLPLENTSLPLPKDHVINKRISSLSYNKKIASLINIISVESLKKNIKFLTGEDPNSFIRTRHSRSVDISKVAEWIGNRMKQYGCPNITYFNFMPGYGPNIICTFKGNKEPEKIVIMSSHYDDRDGGYSPNTRAPGANDDGSGTGAVIEAVRVLSSYEMVLDYTVQVIAFCGEEQGLYGSREYSYFLVRNNVQVIAMIQNDMIGYRKPGESHQIAFPRSPSYASAELNELLFKVVPLFVPELILGYTSACCSDHEYFHKFGFPASASFERVGPIADPMYHNVGDLTERTGYDFEQIWLIARYVSFFDT